MTHRKHVFIFDFDGTIADTHARLIEIYNQLAPIFKYKIIKPEDIANLKNKTSREVIKILRIPLLKIPAILSKGKEEFYSGLDDLKPFAGLNDVLLKLKGDGQTLGIFSSNSEGNIRKFLNIHQMDIFDFIHTTPKVWSKNLSLKKIIEKNNYSFDCRLSRRKCQGHLSKG